MCVTKWFLIYLVTNNATMQKTTTFLLFNGKAEESFEKVTSAFAPVFLLSFTTKTCYMNKLIALTALYLSLFTFAGSPKIHAQALNAEDMKSEMVHDCERSKAYTIYYLIAMPADKYPCKPLLCFQTFPQQTLHLSHPTKLSI